MRALFAGSFDPVTLGHYDLIRRAAADYDSLTVALFINIEKTYLFTLEERLAVLRAAVASLPNVTADTFDGYVADYAVAHGIDTLVRGIRGEADKPYEEKMAAFNFARGGVPTAFYPAPARFASVSSSLLRARLRAGEDISSLCAPGTEEMILRFYQARSVPTSPKDKKA